MPNSRLLTATPQPLPAKLFRGVYSIEPSEFPAPPPGSKVVMTVDSTGTTIGAGWTLDPNSGLGENAWNYLDAKDRPQMPRPPLQLKKP